ncbi:hypothetical protein Tco_0878346 [Tanacetum coccineum]|uniref:Uncharacterized protein n=1 Tax=Tanacetum coccineum TaxID=301880 RepID=A0ABQ5BXR4_9ASTR
MVTTQIQRIVNGLVEKEPASDFVKTKASSALVSPFYAKKVILNKAFSREEKKVTDHRRMELPNDIGLKVETDKTLNVFVDGQRYGDNTFNDRLGGLLAKILLTAANKLLELDGPGISATKDFGRASKELTKALTETDVVLGDSVEKSDTGSG